MSLGLFTKAMRCVCKCSCSNTTPDNKVRELATVCLQQQWTETSVRFEDVSISAFPYHVVVDLRRSLSEWYLLLPSCVLVSCITTMRLRTRQSVREFLASEQTTMPISSTAE
jgi:hypothetical protein